MGLWGNSSIGGGLKGIGDIGGIIDGVLEDINNIGGIINGALEDINNIGGIIDGALKDIGDNGFKGGINIGGENGISIDGGISLGGITGGITVGGVPIWQVGSQAFSGNIGSPSLSSFTIKNPDRITAEGRLHIYRDLKANDTIKIVQGTNDSDSITVKGNVSSTKTGIVHVNVGDGNDIIQINGHITGSGSNRFDMGAGNKTLTAKILDASCNAQNTFIAGAGNHNFSFHSIKSGASGKNTIQTATGTHALSVTGLIEAHNNAANSFTFGNGDAVLTVGTYIKATGKNVLNEFATGDGCTILTVGRDIYSSSEGVNRFSMGDGAHIITIKGKLDSHGGLNEFQLAAIAPIYRAGQLVDVGEHLITLGAMHATGHGTNRIASDGAVNITIGGKMDSCLAVNEIITVEGNDLVSVAKGLYSVGGVNLISTGAGNDYVYIGGMAKASSGGNNTIDTGSGDDIIELNGAIGIGGLHIVAGAGDDTLILHAGTGKQFDNNYRQWLTDFFNKGELAESGLETIRVNIDSPFTSVHVNWLTNLIDLYNQMNPGAPIKLEITGYTPQAFSFGDLFPQAGANEIPGLGSNDNVPGHNGGLSAFSTPDAFLNFGNPADDILAQAGLNVAVV